MVSRKLLKELRVLLKEEYGLSLSEMQVKNMGEFLLKFFGTRAKTNI
jgi:hypothetical protein